MSSMRDWKLTIMVSCAIMPSNRPTTPDTTMPSTINMSSQGRRFLMLCIVGSFRSSSAVKPPSFA